MASKHKKRHSTSLGIREMERKTTIRYYYMPIRMGKMKRKRKLAIANIKEDEEQSEVSSSGSWEEYKLGQPLCKTVQ